MLCKETSVADTGADTYLSTHMVFFIDTFLLKKRNI